MTDMNGQRGIPATLVNPTAEGNPINRWKQTQNFILAIFFKVIAPICPIIVGLLIGNKVSQQSIAISAFMFAVGVAISSENIINFGCMILVSIIFFVGFNQQDAFDITKLNCLGKAGIIVMCLMAVFFIIERIDRHFHRNEIFLDLQK